MLVRFSVTISGAFQLTGGATMNKTVATALTNKDAFLAHVPAQNSGKWTHFFPNLNLGNLDDIVAVKLGLPGAKEKLDSQGILNFSIQ